MKEISDELYAKLEYLGIIDNDVRSHNVGKSDYAENIIQPWTVWRAYPHLSSFDHDIIKRTLRTKDGDSRRMEYEKIIHICQECIRGIDAEEKYKTSKADVINLKKGDFLRCVKSYITDDGDQMTEHFTECWNYMVQKDGALITNQGNRIQPNNDFFNEYFRKINA